jgi:hypothetical protein
MPRHFPAPWRAEKIRGGYVVRDANGKTLAYVSSRATEAEAIEAGVLTEDEARIIADCIAQLRRGRAVGDNERNLRVGIQPIKQKGHIVLVKEEGHFWHRWPLAAHECPDGTAQLVGTIRPADPAARNSKETPALMAIGKPQVRAGARAGGVPPQAL